MSHPATPDDGGEPYLHRCPCCQRMLPPNAHQCGEVVRQPLDLERMAVTLREQIPAAQAFTAAMREARRVPWSSLQYEVGR